MLQIVFGDSECGSLRFAQHCKPLSAGDGPFAVLFTFPDGREPTPEEQEQALARYRERWERENRRARPVGGNPGDVLCPSYNLDIGPLSGPDVEEARRALLTAMLLEYFPSDERSPDEDGNQRDMLWARYLRDSREFLERAKTGEPVRIWYSRAPYSMCGLYDTVWQLRDMDCTVTAIELPRYSMVEDGAVTSSLGWGETSPGDWAAYLPLEREIPRPVRRAMAMDWETLRRENAPLRAVVNGRLRSVEEDFYDSFIRSQIPVGVFMVAPLIGNVLGKCQLGISDWWIAKRVETMLHRGELVLVKEGEYFYRNEVRRA